MLLGGAALTRNYVEHDLRTIYNGRVFYGKDAFEGLRTIETLMEGKRTGDLDPDFGTVPADRTVHDPAQRARARSTPTIDVPARSDVAIDDPVFAPPFVGSRVAKGISLDDIATYVNETALFRGQWQFRPDKTQGRGRRRASGERIRPVLREQLELAKAEGLLLPAVGVGLLRRQRRRQRPRRLEGRRPHAGVAALLVPAPAQATASCASPTSSARPSRASPTTRRSTS